MPPGAGQMRLDVAGRWPDAAWCQPDAPSRCGQMPPGAGVPSPSVGVATGMTRKGEIRRPLQPPLRGRAS
uniref:Uncharacterized protein n=1 Tax=Oryza barthii TaxID=65489 RepID=A0A0D3HTU5_9ORYZ